MPRQPRVRLRLVFGDDARIGPGKIDLLEAIELTGSISAAGRCIGMPYRRAWVLLHSVNTMFGEPVFETSTGGRNGGGAKLTSFGQKLVKAYRFIESETAAQAKKTFAEILPLQAEESLQSGAEQVQPERGSSRGRP